MTTYSYTYKRGRELSDSEIYQQQVAREELLAELKKVEVNLYIDQKTKEPITLCQKCFQGDESYASLEYIDKTASWDECSECGAQNVPANYHGEV